MEEPVVYKPKIVRTLTLIYISALLYSIHFFFTYFVNSSFLNNYFNTLTIGLFFSIGAFINLFIFLNIGKILNRTGNYRLMLLLILLEFACLVGLAYIHNLYLICILFI